MSLLPNGPKGLDAHNCSLYNTRLVWEMTVPMALPEIQSIPGTGEVEKTGRIVNETRIYHIIALTEDFARAALDYRMRGNVINGKVECRAIASIDGELIHESK